MTKPFRIALLAVVVVGQGPAAEADDGSFRIVDHERSRTPACSTDPDLRDIPLLSRGGGFSGFWVEGLAGMRAGTVVASEVKIQQRVLLGAEVQPGRYVGYCMDRHAPAPPVGAPLSVVGTAPSPPTTDAPDRCVQLEVWARSGDSRSIRERRAQCGASVAPPPPMR